MFLVDLKKWLISVCHVVEPWRSAMYCAAERAVFLRQLGLETLVPSRPVRFSTTFVEASIIRVDVNERRDTVRREP